MAIEQKFTDLPAAGSATVNDIICAVQGANLPSNLGLSVQLTLGQVLSLVQSNVILFNAGNPNGLVAGTLYQLCWDTVNNILYICTTAGNAATAVWTKTIALTAGAGIAISQSGDTITISSSSVTSSFVVVSGTSQSMSTNTTYQANNAGLVTLTLPATSSAGDRISIVGFGAGGWTIAQNAGQTIIVGNISSTTGVTGSVSSTNQYDCISLICSVDDLTWQSNVAPQGSLSII
jgi:hypothetical protein